MRSIRFSRLSGIGAWRLPRLGAMMVAFLSSTVSGAEGVAADPVERTVITSNQLEMQGSGARNHFYFTGNVEVKGNNLRILCDSLVVVALREGGEDEAIGQIGAIESIVARGNVSIEQAGRTAFAGLAEVDPQAGTVTLSESPRIIDNDVEVEGYQFVLHKGEKKFVSVPDPNAPIGTPSRSVVRLGEMPDLGFDQDPEAIRLAEPPVTENAEDDPSDHGPEPEGD